ncbi:hypothetical protein SAMN02910297_00165 [Methanobrevibacter olleyae]|uniref:DUF2117 domain-containing protein n=1 Tax=Methanobrevibacter olleyae TaxID=294671 RepID=A0A126R140_METOL|nr:hypothetical protein YLM1_1240 [Methanobrevibacter olleyae]SFL19387.1 hypothetical protein SAMN02910297_00165 [Methanobrevibacter olleyae]
MEIGVVVHGPGIIDSGWAIKIIDILSNFGNVRCRLGGTMGRTAVIDAALENTIDISLKLLPSESLDLFNRENVDVIFLLNYGKSAETGQVFGYKVFNHYFKHISNEDYLATNHKPLYDSRIPVIQIERPGEEDASIISWNVVLNEELSSSKESKRSLLGLGKKDMDDSIAFNFEELFDRLKASLNLNEVRPEEIVSKYFSEDIEKEDEESFEDILKTYFDLDESSNYTYRKIHGVSPGENIFVNGIVVGSSEGESVILIAQNGIIIDIINGVLKVHGVEKLGRVDLNRVIVKTGLLRKSSDISPRILSKEDVKINDAESILYSDDISQDKNSFKIAYVDHTAYDIYKFKNFDLVITIGDDTSLVASDILYRFNIPIIGITDGDLDKVVEKGFVNEKSTIIEVSSGFDDIVGDNIHERLFLSNQTLEIPFDGEAESVEEFKTAVFNVFKARLIENVKEIVPSFIEKDHNYMEVSSYNEFIDDNPNFNDDLNDDLNDEFYLNDEFIDGFDCDELSEEVLNDDFDSPVEEVFIEENVGEIINSVESEDELDDFDGWAEYMEDFKDSIDESDEHDEDN